MRDLILDRIKTLFVTDDELVDAGYETHARIATLSDVELLSLYEEMVIFDG